MAIEAIIDLGTNSALLTVGGAGDAILADACTVVRLGQGLAASRRLHPDAMARARACVSAYVEKAKSLGAARVTITSTAVLRDADDGAAFLAALEAQLTTPECIVVGEIVSGEREAELSFAGALAGLVLHARDVLVLDVGGGSSEVVRGDVGVRARVSFPFGAVRMTERHVHADPPPPAALAAIAAEVRAAVAKAPEALRGAEAAVAVAGTVTTLAAIDLGLRDYDGAKVHGHRLALSRLRAMRDDLAALPLRERLRVPGLPEGRADVIVAGATIVLELLAALGHDGVIVSDGGLRHGRLRERLSEAAASR